jgi:hypothetical protein
MVSWGRGIWGRCEKVTPKEAIAILDGTTKVKSAEDFLAMLMALTKQGKVRAIILTEEESAGIASLLRSQQAEAGAVFDAYIKHQGDIGHGYYCTIDNKGTPCNCGAWELTAAIERLADNNGVSPLLARLEAAEEVARAAEEEIKNQEDGGWMTATMINLRDALAKYREVSK